MSESQDKAPGLDVRRKRALYRSEHRGTKELDWLLGNYARAELGTMSEEDFTLFEDLLSLSEPEIDKMIMLPGETDCGKWAALITHLRRFHGLENIAP